MDAKQIINRKSMLLALTNPSHSKPTSVAVQGKGISVTPWAIVQMMQLVLMMLESNVSQLDTGCVQKMSYCLMSVAKLEGIVIIMTFGLPLQSQV